MTDSTIRLPPDGLGSYVDTENLTVGATSVHRQRFQISGAAAAAIMACMNSAPAGTEYGAVTRPILPSIPAGSALIGAVGLNDGTNAQNIILPGSGQGSALVAGGYKEVPFTTTTVQAVGTTDVGNYKWVSVHITSQGTGSTVTFQVSNDNTNWVSVALVSSSANGAAAGTSATTTTLVHGPLPGRYFRLNVTGISAGTTAGVIEFHAQPSAMQTMAVILATGGSTIGAVNLNAGANVIGHVIADTGSTTAVTALPATPAGTNAIGTVRLDNSLQAVTGISVTAAGGSVATLTIPSAGGGLFNYVTSIRITAYASAAVTGGATPVIATITSGALGGANALNWTFGTAKAQGTNETQEQEFNPPLKGSAAATAMVITGPATTGFLWRIDATYYTGS